MSRLEELIAKLCPNGVEYKRIEEICANIKSGGTPKTSNKDYYGGDIPWLRTQEINFNNIYCTEMTITEDGLKNSSAKWIPANCVIIAMYGATVGKVAINKIPITTNQACCNLEINYELANYNYVFYYLTQEYSYIKSLGQGSQTNINANIVRNLLIPLPPLPVQEEIVRIFDGMDNLICELQHELEQRKKQYEYYLNYFFGQTVEDMTKISKLKRCEIKALADIGMFTRGRRFVKADSVDVGIPCIHYGELYTYYGVSAINCKSFLNPNLPTKLRYANKGDVVIVAAGENNLDIGIGVAWLGNQPVAVHDACYTFSHTCNSKYISYYLRSKIYHNQIKKYVYEGKICSISSDNIGKSLLLLPSLEEQQRIVDILDRFDALCNDPDKGLPAEIALRQKQYEYYRDKLLNFKEKKA